MDIDALQSKASFRPKNAFRERFFLLKGYSQVTFNSFRLGVRSKLRHSGALLISETY